MWGSGPSSAVQDPSIPTFAAPSKRVQKFKDYTNKSMLKVKQVVTPMQGQSFNPSLQSHREILKKVIAEEEK